MVDPDHAPRARRYLTSGYDDGGSLVGRLRIPPEDGALLRKAIEFASDALRADHAETTDSHTSADPIPDPCGATAADALVDVASAYLAGRADAASRRSSDSSAGEVDDRFLVTIIAEHHVLRAPPDSPLDGLSQLGWSGLGARHCQGHRL